MATVSTLSEIVGILLKEAETGRLAAWRSVAQAAASAVTAYGDGNGDGDAFFGGASTAAKAAGALPPPPLSVEAGIEGLTRVMAEAHMQAAVPGESAVIVAALRSLMERAASETTRIAAITAAGPVHAANTGAVLGASAAAASAAITVAMPGSGRRSPAPLHPARSSSCGDASNGIRSRTRRVVVTPLNFEGPVEAELLAEEVDWQSLLRFCTVSAGRAVRLLYLSGDGSRHLPIATQTDMRAALALAEAREGPLRPGTPAVMSPGATAGLLVAAAGSGCWGGNRGPRLGPLQLFMAAEFTQKVANQMATEAVPDLAPQPGCVGRGTPRPGSTGGGGGGIASYDHGHGGTAVAAAAAMSAVAIVGNAPPSAESPLKRCEQSFTFMERPNNSRSGKKARRGGGGGSTTTSGSDGDRIGSADGGGSNSSSSDGNFGGHDGDGHYGAAERTLERQRRSQPHGGTKTHRRSPITIGCSEDVLGVMSSFQMLTLARSGAADIVALAAAATAAADGIDAESPRGLQRTKALRNRNGFVSAVDHLRIQAPAATSPAAARRPHTWSHAMMGDGDSTRRGGFGPDGGSSSGSGGRRASRSASRSTPKGKGGGGSGGGGDPMNAGSGGEESSGGGSCTGSSDSEGEVGGEAEPVVTLVSEAGEGVWQAWRRACHDKAASFSQVACSHHSSTKRAFAEAARAIRHHSGVDICSCLSDAAHVRALARRFGGANDGSASDSVADGGFSAANKAAGGGGGGGADGDGAASFTFVQFAAALASDGVTGCDEPVRHAFQAVDVDGDGVVAPEEILVAAATRRPGGLEERLRAAFAGLDADGDGTVGATEMVTLVRTALGARVAEAERVAREMVLALEACDISGGDVSGGCGGGARGGRPEERRLDERHGPAITLDMFTRAVLGNQQLVNQFWA
ncbi:unnamed protein product [Phaeothamnion confervicola]